MKAAIMSCSRSGWPVSVLFTSAGLAPSRAWHRAGAREGLSEGRERPEACLQVAWGLQGERMAGQDPEIVLPP